MAGRVGLAPIAGPPDPDGGDCVACGRCCHHGPSTVHLLEADEIRMGDALLTRLTVLVERPPGWRFMKNAGSCCGALDTSAPGRYPCSVYEVRPDDCRLVEAGSPCCLEARRLGHLGQSVEFTRPRAELSNDAPASRRGTARGADVGDGHEDDTDGRHSSR